MNTLDITDARLQRRFNEENQGQGEVLKNRPRKENEFAFELANRVGNR